jgi:chemotaxis protein CheX
MNYDDHIVGALRHASIEVFSTMLGTDLGPCQISVQQGAPETTDGVVSFIGLAGAWAGTGSIYCSPELACRICSLMLLAETTSVNEDVLDAVAELTNMIIGCAKTELEQHLGTLGLSIPTVVFGRNFHTKSAGTAEWLVLEFLWEGQTLLVKLCLTQSTGPRAPQVLGHSCPIEV